MLKKESSNQGWEKVRKDQMQNGCKVWKEREEGQRMESVRKREERGRKWSEVSREIADSTRRKRMKGWEKIGG